MSAVDQPPALDVRVSFWEHLDELRRRLTVSLLLLAGASALVYPFTPAITEWLARPLGGLFFTRPFEAFDTRLKVSCCLGLAASLPLVFAQAWAFAGPALGVRARRTLGRTLPAAYVLFLAGGALAFFVVLPPATAFFLSFGTQDVHPLISISEYVDFTLRLVVSFGLAFQTPLVMLLLARLGIVSSARMRGARRGVYLTAFVAGAFLTSPEVLTQISLAVSLIALYELGLILTSGARREA
ncbi:MAG TPA: twin-arginine translocase subunit TatC [Verrucomicrobiae bacterium]|nr:twin-arginine translocase subunit TatC [Verrucomicrobiae bacterium]